MMKAYMVYSVNWKGCAIVFAENAGLAKSKATLCACCWDSPWTDIRVRREPAADSLYNGQFEIAWDNKELRKVLQDKYGVVQSEE